MNILKFNKVLGMKILEKTCELENFDAYHDEDNPLEAIYQGYRKQETAKGYTEGGIELALAKHIGLDKNSTKGMVVTDFQVEGDMLKIHLSDLLEVGYIEGAHDEELEWVDSLKAQVKNYLLKQESLKL